MFTGTYFDSGVNQSCRTNDLFNEDSLALFELIVSWRCADENDLIDSRFPFIELQRSVIKRRRQTEAIFDKSLLPGSITGIHRSDLRNRYVRLVNDRKKVFLKIVEQTVWTGTSRPPRQMTRIVFDALTIPHFAHHFKIEPGSLFKTLSLNEFPHIAKFCRPLP